MEHCVSASCSKGQALDVRRTGRADQDGPRIAQHACHCTPGVPQFRPRMGTQHCMAHLPAGKGDGGGLDVHDGCPKAQGAALKQRHQGLGAARVLQIVGVAASGVRMAGQQRGGGRQACERQCAQAGMQQPLLSIVQAPPAWRPPAACPASRRSAASASPAAHVDGKERNGSCQGVHAYAPGPGAHGPSDCAA